jgi:hypothetical protein
MTLREEQQRMLRLLKHSSPADDVDPLMREKLELQMKIIVWWRCFQFEHWLILTSKLLKDQHLFDPFVRDLYKHHNISSYPAEAGEQFIEYVVNQPISPSIKSVAMLESALIRLKDSPDEAEYRIRWNVSPLPFLDALINGREYFLEDANNEHYEMVVSNRIPGKMMVNALT